MSIEAVDIPVRDDDGTTSPMRAVLARPTTAGPHPAVVVLHELFGVNADIRGVLSGLAAAGFLALAPELYHRAAAPGLSLERNAAGRERGFALLHQLTRDGVVADVRAARAYLRERPDATGRVGLLGFSAGGHAAFVAATRLDLPATVVLYGGWLTVTDIPLSRPEPTITLAKGITGRLAYLVGADDALVSPAQRQEIEDALSAAGVRHEVVAYPGAAHAFFWAGTDGYDAAATDQAWRKTLTIFAEELR